MGNKEIIDILVTTTLCQYVNVKFYHIFQTKLSRFFLCIIFRFDNLSTALKGLTTWTTKILRSLTVPNLHHMFFCNNKMLDFQYYF